MDAGELRRILRDVPDAMPVVVEIGHEARVADASIGIAQGRLVVSRSAADEAEGDDPLGLASMPGGPVCPPQRPWWR